MAMELVPRGLFLEGRQMLSNTESTSTESSSTEQTGAEPSLARLTGRDDFLSIFLTFLHLQGR